ncbi:WD40 repeat domain-containing protein [Streptomyces phaeofaciens]|uniref:WD40 repeat domain-containing protein n=1 Tax=Streptomyces phaeofaciens TaxID=68254 RepID=UPI00167BECE4
MTAVAFSPTESLLATADGFEGTLRLWNPDTETPPGSSALTRGCGGGCPVSRARYDGPRAPRADGAGATGGRRGRSGSRGTTTRTTAPRQRGRRSSLGVLVDAGPVGRPGSPARRGG